MSSTKPTKSKTSSSSSSSSSAEPLRARRSKRACTKPGYESSSANGASSSSSSGASSSSSTATALRLLAEARGRHPTGRILIVHANDKPYGRGAGGTKASNRAFPFSCKDYLAMRDSYAPYSGNPSKNKLLPLPRPTYTEFINRAKKARMPDRLDFMFCPASAPQPPRMDFHAYERVIWAGVSFRRFSKIWTPPRHCFFRPEFKARAVAIVACAWWLRRHGDPATCSLAGLPDELLFSIVAFSADKKDSRRDSYDDLDTVLGGAQHLFLPAPGSSGMRETLFDGVFGL